MGISVSAVHGDKATKEDKLDMLKGYLQSIALKRRVLKKLGISYEETDKYIIEHFQEEIESMEELDEVKLGFINAMNMRTEIGIVLASQLSSKDMRKLMAQIELDEETRESMNEALDQLEFLDDAFGDDEGVS